MKPTVNKINIAIAEDNPFLRDSLIRNLNLFNQINLKIIARNGWELLQEIQKNSIIDIILMDIEMPKMNGIEATKKIKKRYPHIKIIMLTVFDDDENIFLSIKAGANGYILKDIQPEKLVESIDYAHNYNDSFSPEIVSKSIELLRKADLSNLAQTHSEIKLTKRESEVLLHLSKGLSYFQISKNLNISEGTVRKHIENIYNKLDVHNKIEAIQKASSLNIL